MTNPPAARPHGKRADLREVRQDATDLVWQIRRHGVEAGLLMTLERQWSNRKRLDVMLELARRAAEQADPRAAARAGATAKERAEITRQRIEDEEERWTDDAALDAYRRYRQGVRDPDTLEGTRVHTRRERRRKREGDRATERMTLAEIAAEAWSQR